MNPCWLITLCTLSAMLYDAPHAANEMGGYLFTGFLEATDVGKSFIGQLSSVIRFATHGYAMHYGVKHQA